MSNIEVAKKVKEELEKRGLDVKFEKIIDDMDVTFDDNAKEEDIENVVESYLAEYEM